MGLEMAVATFAYQSWACLPVFQSDVGCDFRCHLLMHYNTRYIVDQMVTLAKSHTYETDYIE